MAANDLERETTDVLQELVRFNTVNPPGNERAAIEFLAGYLKDAGLETELLADDEDRPNLVADLAADNGGGPDDGATSATSTLSSPTPPSGPTIPGPATSPTASCGAAARST